MEVQDMLGNPILLGSKVALCTTNTQTGMLRWGIAIDFDQESKRIIVKDGDLKRAIQRSGRELIVIMMPIEDESEKK
jgi:hypothetical protein